MDVQDDSEIESADEDATSEGKQHGDYTIFQPSATTTCDISGRSLPNVEVSSNCSDMSFESTPTKSLKQIPDVLKDSWTKSSPKNVQKVKIKKGAIKMVSKVVSGSVLGTERQETISANDAKSVNTETIEGITTDQIGEEFTVAPLRNSEEEKDDQFPVSSSSCYASTKSVASLGKRKEGKYKVDQNIENNAQKKSRKENKTHDLSEDENNSDLCFFCKTSFTGGVKIMHIILGKPLPTSSLDPVSLLQCFGMQFSSPVESEGVSPVDIPVCGKCYLVLKECDILYPHLYSVVSKILEVWPEKLKGKKALSLNISFPENEYDDFHVKSHEKMTDVTRLASNKLRMDQQMGKKKFIPDVQLSFSYTKKTHFLTKTSEILASTNIYDNDDAVHKTMESGGIPRSVSIRKMFTCEFCGIAFCSEQDWSSHLTSKHKVMQKWLSYRLQVILKRCIIKELQWNNSIRQKVDIGQKCDIDQAKCRCYACNCDLLNRNEFIDHLRNFHNMIIDSSDKIDDPSQVACETLQEEPDNDQFSTCFTDSSTDTTNVRVMANMESKIQVGCSGSKYEDFVQDEDDENNVKKILAPHWLCRICGLSFSSQTVLDKHRNQAHDPKSTRTRKKKLCEVSGESSCKTEVTCIDCNQILDSHKALKEHWKCVHNYENKGPAESHKRPVEDDSERYIVILKGDGEGGVTDHRVNLSKGLGEDVGNDQRPVQNHEIKTEAVEANINEKYKCDTCGEEFISLISLIKHSRSVHEKVDVSGVDEVVMLECELCKRRLHNKSALRLHMARVHRDPHKENIKKYRCKICKSWYQRKAQQMEHMKEKHGINIKSQVTCHVCGKLYDASYIDRHIAIIHESGKKYSCKFCKMKFNDLVYLKRHIYFDHANDKWKCEKCHLEFKKYHQLRQHRTSVHSTVVIKCSDCEKTYKRKSDLTCHRKRCHQVKVPSVCKYCSKSIMSPSKFRNHLIKQHGVAWEDTLSKRYARHYQENNCLQRPSLSVKYLKSSKKESNSKDCDQQEESQYTQCNIGSCESDPTSEDEDSQQSGQQEYSNLSKSKHFVHDETTSVKALPEVQYNIEVTQSTDNMADIGEISYIILEESND